MVRGIQVYHYYFFLVVKMLPVFLNVSPSPSEGGYVNPRTGTYNAGEAVNILASANEYFKFDRWSGGWNGTSPSVTITMDSDKNISAIFIMTDNDKDGVENSLDLCPGSQGEIVDSNGCGATQKDTDGDGVDDSIDICNNTNPSALIISSNGCEVEVFSYADNGVTIKASPLSQSGLQQQFNGNTYYVVSEEELRQKVQDGEDLTFVVTSKVTNMEDLFKGKDVNGDISSWDVSNVTRMDGLFQNSSFNGDISMWDVSKVAIMTAMFKQSDFQGDISMWDVSSVDTMNAMFQNTIYNGDISNWDLSNVTELYAMFKFY